jgi:hypothetical protein
MRKLIMGFAIALLSFCAYSADPEYLTITNATWDQTDNSLTVKGLKNNALDIELRNALDSQVYGTFTCNKHRWKFTVGPLTTPPCKVLVTATNSKLSDAKNVKWAPNNCAPKPPENIIPIAKAGHNLHVLAQRQTGVAVVMLNGTASSDDDGYIAHWQWAGVPNPDDIMNPVLELEPGDYNFSLVVIDNNGKKSIPDTVEVKVSPPLENEAPTAKPIKRIIITPDLSHDYDKPVEVEFDGSESFDSDGIITNWIWEGIPVSENTAKPKVALFPGEYIFFLQVEDNEGALSERVEFFVQVKPYLLAPIANAGPDQILFIPLDKDSKHLFHTVYLDGTKSTDQDGYIVDYKWSGKPELPNPKESIITLEPGTYTYTLVVTDNTGIQSAPDSVEIVVETLQAGADPHASLRTYLGPQTCIACHEKEAKEIINTVHYQQNGTSDSVTNLSAPSGEFWNGKPGEGFTGVNSYCGTHINSPRFTCAGCHIGNGKYPAPYYLYNQMGFFARYKEHSNIDCLMCHQDKYKRFPDPSNGFAALKLVGANEITSLPDPTAPAIELKGFFGVPLSSKSFQYVPLDPTDKAFEGFPGELMPISALKAAQTVHATTRRSCLNCHAKAGGGDGLKRGDISSALLEPEPNIDVHMSPKTLNFSCSDCHSGGKHAIKGRGIDLRPNDYPERLECTLCHRQNVHEDYDAYDGKSLDMHATHVACQTCHITHYGKEVATEIARDWLQPHFSKEACNGRGGWLPADITESYVTPEYTWFNGTSKIYVLGQSIHNFPTEQLKERDADFFGLPHGSEAFVIASPNGSVLSGSSKIYPVKTHVGRLALDENDLVIPHSTFEYFKTGNFNKAVLAGQISSDDESLEGTDYTMIQVKEYQLISHGVNPADESLECKQCHKSLSNTPVRMDMNKLGYGLKNERDKVCLACHSKDRKHEKEMSFLKMHEKHVKDKHKDCSHCHNFSRAERNLILGE